jgi:hypothetical protein
MSELTYNEYWKEINEIAYTLVEESMDDCDNDKGCAEEQINDYRLHETIDGHQWVIYYGYNLDVIKQSDNEDYYNDNFGAESLATSLEQGGLDMLHCHIAFWCMYADVQDALEAAFDEYEADQAA